MRQFCLDFTIGNQNTLSSKEQKLKQCVSLNGLEQVTVLSDFGKKWCFLEGIKKIVTASDPGGWDRMLHGNGGMRYLLFSAYEVMDVKRKCSTC